MLKCLWKWIFLQIFRSSINVVLPNRNPLIQRVIYETLPKFCKVLGHTTRACSKDNVDARPVEKAGLANVATMNNVKDSVFTRLSPPVDDSPVDAQPTDAPVVDVAMSRSHKLITLT